MDENQNNSIDMTQFGIYEEDGKDFYNPNDNSGIDIPEIAIPDMQKGNSKKRWIILGIIIAIIGIILAGFAIYYVSMRDKIEFAKSMTRFGSTMENFKNPLVEEIQPDQLLDKLVYEDSLVETELNIGGMENVPVTIGVDASICRSNVEKELQGNIALSVMRYNLGTLNIYGNEDMLTVQIPELLDDSFSMNLKSFGKDYNQSLLAKLLKEQLPEDLSLQLFAQKPEIETQNVKKTYATLLENTKDILEISEIHKDETIQGLSGDVPAIGYSIHVPAEKLNQLAGEEVVTESLELEILVDKEKRDVREIRTIVPIQLAGVKEGISIVWDLENIGEDMLHQACNIMYGQNDEVLQLCYAGNITRKGGEYSQNFTADIALQNRAKDVAPQPETNTESQQSASANSGAEGLQDGNYHINGSYLYYPDSKQVTLDMQLQDAIDSVQIVGTGKLADIVSGESIAVHMDNIQVLMNEEQLFTMFGDVSIKDMPEGTVFVKPEQTTDLFGITELDLLGLALSLKIDMDQISELGKLFGELGIF